MNKNLGIPLILIAIGALILMNKFGFNLLGPIMSYVIPIAMVALGYLGIKNGNKLGWLLAGVGAIILVGKLAGWLVILLAIGLIVYGFSMLRKSPQT
ncbi:LiaF transmembrane domain-containing protein [Paenibacillus eucommiae]|uniref:Membrane protein YkgB n=1 Tax=Paenibacillus eucommiae TaxID=1355755 RepID=A0ABS4IXR4_9BACL|nr:hypothetical protein [Paenibacillus eucommiae]MBP1992375.1 putative membrane protein YkgB [Paenibacillus eucommiae]